MTNSTEDGYVSQIIPFSHVVLAYSYRHGAFIYIYLRKPARESIRDNLPVPLPQD